MGYDERIIVYLRKIMNTTTKLLFGAVAVVLVVLLVLSQAPSRDATSDARENLKNDIGMSFFVTSVNPGKGADLGGLAGADAYCRSLAASVGEGEKTWRSYLSSVATGTALAVNARDRIGSGPWYNAKGVMVARSIDDLHSSMNNLTKETALTEKGEVVLGRGDTPNMHDILTGSTEEGTASTTATVDTTCGNWTSGGIGSAVVGHHDRIGINDSAPMKSWVSSHGSRGCDMEALKSTGGAGLFYCFAE
jgi:hypothetical protein